MRNTNPAIDAYILKSADFAQPIMIHLRELVHATCPDVEEKMKWSFPHFDYKGEMMCSMAAFKQHCVFGFWKASIIPDPQKILTPVGETAMGNFGKITRLEDLPADDILIAYIKEAKRLNDEGVKVKPNTKAKAELPVPDYMMDAIRKDAKALETFVNFSVSCKREYVEWVTEAKSEETRLKRLDQAIEWMAEGKIRNWKYVKKYF
jgi:uncharacterized protein YdeI (YjbR/CyaY-like superfamily)